VTIPVASFQIQTMALVYARTYTGIYTHVKN
jgi:hypothetical protein